MISDTAQQGTGMLAMFVNLDQKWRNDFRIWLKEDMFTARLNIGFQACASYDLIPEVNTTKGHAQAFLTICQTASLGVLYSEPYQELRRYRDAKDAEFHNRFLDVERYTLSWVGPEVSDNTSEFAPIIYVDRFNLTDANNQVFNQWFVDSYLSGCEKIKSIIRVRRYTAVEGIPEIFLLHELKDLAALNDRDWETLRENEAWQLPKIHGGGSAAYKRVISATQLFQP